MFHPATSCWTFGMIFFACINLFPMNFFCAAVCLFHGCIHNSYWCFPNVPAGAIALNKWDDGVVGYMSWAIWYGNCWSLMIFKFLRKCNENSRKGIKSSLLYFDSCHFWNIVLKTIVAPKHAIIVSLPIPRLCIRWLNKHFWIPTQSFSKGWTHEGVKPLQRIGRQMCTGSFISVSIQVHR